MADRRPRPARVSTWQRRAGLRIGVVLITTAVAAVVLASRLNEPGLWPLAVIAVGIVAAVVWALHATRFEVLRMRADYERRRRIREPLEPVPGRPREASRPRAIVDRLVGGFVLGALVASWLDTSTSNVLAVWAALVIGLPAVGAAIDAAWERSGRADARDPMESGGDG